LSERHFLFLQGPHGPFFAELAKVLQDAGCKVSKIGFNQGDAHFWKDRESYTPYTGRLEEWGQFLDDFLHTEKVTDVVLYGDTREVHVVGREQAHMRALSVHCFEEGYLRPFWVTYERGGVNGHSRLMEMSVSQMQRALEGGHREVPDTPAQWGALWHHTLMGAIYHFHVLFFNGKYRNYVPHRSISVLRELGLHLRRLFLFPVYGWQRRVQTYRLRRSGAPYHIVLMQLAHDASFVSHGEFDGIGEFIDLCCKGFASGAAGFHHLVFKTHPLEDDREPISWHVRTAARRYGIEKRVHLVRGGKLGPLLNKARSAVTVNSTAGQQALWRGLPLRVFGRSVYSKPEFVSYQPLEKFFRDPAYPDVDAYRDYRQFLLETSQISGGYYTSEGRADVLRGISDVILANTDPYERRYLQRATKRQHLRVLRGGRQA
jgi:capsular polysaccharide export protein